MRSQSSILHRCVAVLGGILPLAGLYLISLYSYLLFHSIAEVFSIVVACGIFLVAWNSRRFLDNNTLLFIGIAFVFVAGIDLLHTLSYRGMGVFRGYGIDLPTQLWIAARYLHSISLFIAPLFLGKPFNTKTAFLVYSGAVTGLLGSIFYWDIFPVCYAEGVGLTPFKKISEYLICLILIGAIATFSQKQKEFDRGVFRLLIVSIVLTMASELAFTFYVDVYGFFNLIGHYLKIISFYLIYKAIIETGLVRPYDLLFRNLKRSEKVLRESEEKYRTMMEAMVDPVYICSSEFRVMYMNPAMIQRTGRDAKGEICHKAIHNFDEKCPFCAYDRVEQGEHVEAEILSPKDGRFYLVSQSPVIHSDGSISKMTIYKDITEHKRAEEALEKARLELEQRVMERTFELKESNERLKQEIAERLQTELALQNSEAELRRLSSRLLNAQEEERKRIARELHDGIGQSLSAIKFTVETALNEMAQENPAQVVESLETVVPVVKGAVEEVRTISRNLRPSVLDDLGILATISWFCREIENTYSGIRINRQIRIEEGDVPADLKTVIFRLLQEAVNNVTKHSQATVIDLFLEGRNGKIELTIKDNGIGFDLEQVVTEGRVKDGIGLSSMRERTELSNGSFLIKSQKGTGTTVRASWSLREAED
jgi:PAS domain S-box-containing protein